MVRTPSRYVAGLIALAAYAGTVWAANWAISRYGFVGVGFGYVAPAGVYFVAVALVLRDIVQNTLGRTWSLLGIAIGALLSAWINPHLAAASAVAFGVSEFADFMIYTPMYRRDWTRAALVAGAFGAVVDSLLFLWLAFGSLTFWQGQIIGKWEGVAVAVLVCRFGLRRLYAVQPA